MILEILVLILLFLIILGPIFLVSLFPGPELVIFLILYFVIVSIFIAIIPLLGPKTRD